MVSKLAFAFKIIRPIIFSTVKKVSFPQSRNFSLVKELFHNQGPFLQSRNFCHGAVVDILHGQGNFLQKNLTWSIKFSTKKWSFLLSRKFFTRKKITWSKKISTNRKFFHKIFFLDHGSFLQTKIFTQSKNFSANNDQKGSLKVKILDWFNTTSCAKIFLTL